MGRRSQSTAKPTRTARYARKALGQGKVFIMAAHQTSGADASTCSEVKNRGQFVKGISGNPGGRPKTILADGRTLREVAMAHTEDAVAVLAQVMHDRSAPKASRVSAAIALLDRAWGRPMQELQVGQQVPKTELTPEQNQSRIDALIQLAIHRIETRKKSEAMTTR